MKKFLAALVGIGALLLGGCSLFYDPYDHYVVASVRAYNHTDKIITFSYSDIPKGPPPKDMSKGIPFLHGGGDGVLI